MLTCASGRFIQGGELALAAASCESARARRRSLTVDPRGSAWRGTACMIREGGVWSVKLASCTLAILERRLPFASARWSLVNAGVARPSRPTR